jgi:hypothetical protein
MFTVEDSNIETDGRRNTIYKVVHEAFLTNQVARQQRKELKLERQVWKGALVETRKT